MKKLVLPFALALPLAAIAPPAAAGSDSASVGLTAEVTASCAISFRGEISASSAHSEDRFQIRCGREDAIDGDSSSGLAPDAPRYRVETTPAVDSAADSNDPTNDSRTDAEGDGENEAESDGGSVTTIVF